MLLKVILKHVNVMITSNKSGLNLKKKDFETWKFWEFDILPDFLHENQDNSLNFQETGFIIDM